MFIKIVGIFAEFERENLAERVSFGFEQKAREGNYIHTSGVYGYDYDKGVGDIVLNHDEAETVKKIFAMYLEGHSATVISKWLIENQVPTKKGGRWVDSTVLSILSNPLYIGTIRYGLYNQKESFTVENTRYPHVVDDDTFNRVQEILENRRKNTPRNYPSENSYFLTFLVCDECGRRFSTNQHIDPKSKNQKLHVNYYCRGRHLGECTCRGFSQPKIEQAFQSYINNFKDFTAEESASVAKEPSKDEDKRTAIEKKIAQNTKRIEDIRLLFTQDKLSFEEYREFSSTLSIKGQQLAEELAKITTEEPDEIDVEAVRDIIVSLRQNWVNLTNAEKKQFLTMFIESIHVRHEDGPVTISEIKFNNGRVKEDRPKAKKKRMTVMN